MDDDLLPIQSLSPTLHPPSDKSVRAIVSLVWPYSSSTRKLAVLLADPDFRLRSQRGQVRVQFSGACAVQVAESKLGIGDEVVLGLNGAEWVRQQGEGDVVRTPGKSVEGELVFGERLRLMVRGTEGERTVDVDGADHVEPATGRREQEEEGASVETPVSKVNGHGTRTARREELESSQRGDLPTYSSPAFAKRLRLSRDAFVGSGYDPFADDDMFDQAAEKGSGRSFGTVSQWKLVGRSPSPVKDASPISSTSPVALIESDESQVEQSQAAESSPVPLDDSAPANDLSVTTRQASSQPPQNDIPTSDATAMPPPPLPQLRVPDIESSQTQEHASLLDDDDRPSTPKIQPVASATLPLPSPFPKEISSAGLFASEATAVSSQPEAGDKVVPIEVDEQREPLRGLETDVQIVAELAPTETGLEIQEADDDSMSSSMAFPIDYSTSIQPQDGDIIVEVEYETRSKQGTIDLARPEEVHASHSPTAVQSISSDGSSVLPEYEDANEDEDEQSELLGNDDTNMYDYEVMDEDDVEEVIDPEELGVAPVDEDESMSDVSESISDESESESESNDSEVDMQMAGEEVPAERSDDEVEAESSFDVVELIEDERDVVEITSPAREDRSSPAEIFLSQKAEKPEDLPIAASDQAVPGPPKDENAVQLEQSLEGVSVTTNEPEEPQITATVRQETETPARPRGQSGLLESSDHPISTSAPAKSTPRSTPQSERDRVMAQTLNSLFGFAAAKEAPATPTPVQRSDRADVSTAMELVQESQQIPAQHSPAPVTQGSLKDADDSGAKHGESQAVDEQHADAMAIDSDAGDTAVHLPQYDGPHDVDVHPITEATEHEVDSVKDAEDTTSPEEPVKEALIATPTPADVVDLVSSSEDEGGSDVEVQETVGVSHMDQDFDHDKSESFAEYLGLSAPGATVLEDAALDSTVPDVAGVEGDASIEATPDMPVTPDLAPDIIMDDAAAANDIATGEVEGMPDVGNYTNASPQEDAAPEVLDLRDQSPPASAPDDIASVSDEHQSIDSMASSLAQSPSIVSQVSAGTGEVDHDEQPAQPSRTIALGHSQSLSPPEVTRVSPESIEDNIHLPTSHDLTNEDSHTSQDITQGPHTNGDLQVQYPTLPQISQASQVERTVTDIEVASTSPPVAQDHIATALRVTESTPDIYQALQEESTGPSIREPSMAPPPNIDIADEGRLAAHQANDQPPLNQTPVRRSLRKRLSHVPDVISAWFSPKTTTVEEEPPATPEPASPTVSVNGASLTQSQLASLRRSPRLSRKQLSQGITTSTSYFIPLSRLEVKTNPPSQQTHGSGLVDILAIVTDDTSAPERAKNGPRDFFTVFHIVDASVNANDTYRVEVYRPWKATLPVAQAGDVVLMRSFMVKSRQRQPYLLSTDASAWCVWRYAEAQLLQEHEGQPGSPGLDGDGRVHGLPREEVKGPPVEFGDDERIHARALREEWLRNVRRDDSSAF